MKSMNGKTGMYILFLVSGTVLGAVFGGRIMSRVSRVIPLPKILAGRAGAPAPDTAAAAAPASRPVPAGAAVSASRSNAIVTATRKVSPGVVGIVVTQLQVVRRLYYYNDFFDFFFGPDLLPRYKEVESMGSGFVFDGRGHILTNYHVVQNAHTLFVSFADGRKIEGRIVGVDPPTDLAVLRVTAKNVPSVVLGDSHGILIGEWAIAIGNPFGYFINDAHPTVTVGVVSALNRNFMPEKNTWYKGMIQTDAAINPGNSGGPLVNARGEVVGINTFIFTGDRDYRGSIGIGFAIPINRARRVARELIRYGERRPAWTGITVQDLTRSSALALGYEYTDGVIVAEVRKGSPGAAAGLRRYDIITWIGRQRIRSSGDIDESLLDYFVGDRVAIRYIRKGRSGRTSLVLKKYPRGRR